MRLAAIGLGILAFTACGTDQNFDPKLSPPPSCAGVRCVPNPSVMIFKTQNGHDLVSWGDVTHVDVRIFKPLVPGSTSPGELDLARSFHGGGAISIVRQLALAFPKENGAPASMGTGQVEIHYQRHTDSSEQTRLLTIQNSRLIEDGSFPEVTYDPKVIFDRRWLETQALQ